VKLGFPTGDISDRAEGGVENDLHRGGRVWGSERRSEGLPNLLGLRRARPNRPIESAGAVKSIKPSAPPLVSGGATAPRRRDNNMTQWKWRNGRDYRFAQGLSVDAHSTHLTFTEEARSRTSGSSRPHLAAGLPLRPGVLALASFAKASEARSRTCGSSTAPLPP